MSSARSQLKIAGTQKCSPFPPLRTPSFPLPKIKECYFSLGGDRGHPFAQHCSCPAILRCSVGLTKAAFWELSLCGKNGCLNRTGVKPLRSIGKAATSVLPPLTQVALVARPCAPAAQMTDDSSSSSRRLAISLCRFASLDIEQDCSFRMPLTK